MGMSTYAVGFAPPDERWKQMRAVWDACRAAGLPVPAEVETFFNDRPPDDAGVRIVLHDTLAKKWRTENAESGLEVDLDELRARYPQIKKLRFINAW